MKVVINDANILIETRVNRAKKQFEKGIIQLNFKKMESNSLLDKNSARVFDILEQVKELNKMIDLHKSQSGDSFMVNQYQDMKNRFLEELKEILSDYEIEVLIKGKAA